MHVVSSEGLIFFSRWSHLFSAVLVLSIAEDHNNDPVDVTAY